MKLAKLRYFDILRGMADDLLTDRNWRWARRRWQFVDEQRLVFSKTFSAAQLNLAFALRDLARDMRTTLPFVGINGSRMMLWLTFIGIAVAIGNIAEGLAR